MKKRLILMRGLPGSGKSTLAKTFSGKILSTDEYFMVEGEYRYDITQLPKAHEWNQARAKLFMIVGAQVIIIDNCNVQRAHMQPYIDLAIQYGYEVEYAIPETPWCFDVAECTKRNTHHVPAEAIQRMLDRWED